MEGNKGKNWSSFPSYLNNYLPLKESENNFSVIHSSKLSDKRHRVKNKEDVVFYL